MKQLVRIFIAVEISSRSVPQIEKLIYRFVAAGADVKWVESGLFHITLKFLGDVEQTDIVEVCRAVQKAVQDIPPFEIRVMGAGAFPNTKMPRTIWLGLDQGTEELTTLFQAVEKAMVAIGFAPEIKQFAAHVTLGRIRKPNAALKDLGELIEQAPRYDAGKSYITQVDVMASELTRKGPIYSVLAVCPLKGITKPEE